MYTLEHDIWERDKAQPWYRDWRTLAAALALSCIGILVSGRLGWHPVATQLILVADTVLLQGCRTLSRLPGLSRYDGGILLWARYPSFDYCHFCVCAVLAGMVHQRDQGRGR